MSRSLLNSSFGNMPESYPVMAICLMHDGRSRNHGKRAKARCQAAPEHGGSCAD